MLGWMGVAYVPSTIKRFDFTGKHFERLEGTVRTSSKDGWQGRTEGASDTSTNAYRRGYSDCARHRLSELQTLIVLLQAL